MRIVDKGGTRGGDRRPGGSRVAGSIFRGAVDADPIHTASWAEGLPEVAISNAAEQTALRIQPGVGFRGSSSQRSASGFQVDDDGLWDVFLADDLDEEPQPERGDFWLDGQ